MSILFKLRLLCFCALFAGCVSNDPQSQKDREDRRAQYSTNATRLAENEFHALIPVCLNFLENGQRVSDAEMARLGFRTGVVSKSYRSFKKVRGDSIIDRVNMKNTEFSITSKRRLACNFSLGDYGSIQEGGNVLRDALVRYGYAYVGSQDMGNWMASRMEFRFVKGNVSLYLTGNQIGSIASYSILK